MADMSAAEKKLVEQINDSAKTGAPSTMAGDLNPAFYPNVLKSEPMRSEGSEEPKAEPKAAAKTAEPKVEPKTAGAK